MVFILLPAVCLASVFGKVVLLLLKVDFTEELGTVVVRLRGAHGVPGDEMGFRQGIATFVEIGCR